MNTRERSVLCLIAVLVMVLLVGCGGNSSDSGTQQNESTPTASQDVNKEPTATSTPTLTPTPTPEPIRDLGGITVVLGDSYSNNPPDNPTGARTDAGKQAQKERMETYHFTFEKSGLISYGDLNKGGRAILAIQDNKPVSDIYTVEPAFLSNLFDLENGVFYACDVSTLEEFDLSNEKWDQSAIEHVTIGNTVYGFATGSFHPSYSYVVFVNTDLLDKILGEGATDQLFDWQRNGEWTWDKMKEVSLKCLAESKKATGQQVFGVAAENYTFHRAAMASDGQSFVTKDVQNRLTSNLDNPRLTAVFEWVAGMNKDNAILNGKEYNEWGMQKAAFMQGKAAMYVGQYYSFSEFAYSMPDAHLAMLIFPKAPDAEKYTVYYDPAVLVIPNCEATKSRMSDIAFAYDVYSDPIPEETNNQYEGAVNTIESTFGGRSAQETVAILFESEVFVDPDELLGISAYGSDTLGKIQNEIVWNTRKPADAIEAGREEVTALIDKFNSLFAK